MTTYLVRFSTNGIDQTEYTLTVSGTMTRRDFTDVACAVTGVAIQPETITIYQQIYPA
jgi:hypothetical protein